MCGVGTGRQSEGIGYPHLSFSTLVPSDREEVFEPGARMVAGKPRGSSLSLHLPSARVTSVHGHTKIHGILHRWGRFEPRGKYLYSKGWTPLSYLPSPNIVQFPAPWLLLFYDKVCNLGCQWGLWSTVFPQLVHSVDLFYNPGERWQQKSLVRLLLCKWHSPFVQSKDARGISIRSQIINLITSPHLDSRKQLKCEGNLGYLKSPFSDSSISLTKHACSSLGPATTEVTKG